MLCAADAVANAYAIERDANAPSHDAGASDDDAMAYVVKENCWRKETKHGDYFLKYYDRLDVAKKVRLIHKRFTDSQFPHHIPLEKNIEEQTILQRWVSGRSANYNVLEDRIKTVDCLQNLHMTNNYIQWRTEPLPTQNLKDKWRRRYERFCEQQQLRSILGDSYERILQIAKAALEKIEQVPSSPEPLTILHGDVVHHNVLITEGETYLIDFDLAMFGEASDEIILWLQRALPNVDYELNQLLSEHPYLEIAKQKLDYLRFPNEVMREALYMLQLDGAKRAYFEVFLHGFIQDYLLYYNRLLAHIESQK
ncbi:MAG: phosphotransferase [Solibacillus sp.]